LDSTLFALMILSRIEDSWRRRRFRAVLDKIANANNQHPSDQGRNPLSVKNAFNPATRYCHTSRRPSAPRLSNQFQHPACKEPWMRRRLRRSIPFLLAIFFGMIAGVLVAGVAILAAHP
jgi:hypothetical protein